MIVRPDRLPKASELCNHPHTKHFPTRNEVHVCAIKLSAQSSDVHHWRAFLCGSERARADQFAFEKDRVMYTITRGVLRTVLGQYLHASPAALTITPNAFGKPEVARDQNPGHLTFNVSHSGDYALLAFAAQTPLGVDIEEIRPKDRTTDLSKAVLSPNELAQFRQLGQADRQRAFFRAWTRKEAFVKGVGEGLSIPLATVDAEGAPGWSIRDLDVDSGYAAAAAVQREEMDLRLWNW